MFEPEMQYTEMGWAGANKHDETLCGDCFKAFHSEGKKVFVLSDGLGSGVKANILSTLTATILGTMLTHGITLEEGIDTVVSTLPICRVRQLAYSTFVVLQLEHNVAYLAQYDNPAVIVMRGGKNLNYPKDVRFVGQKEIHESRIPFVEDDIFIMMTDGVTNAGIGKLASAGWKREEIIAFLERLDVAHMSAPRIAAHIVNGCLALSQDSLDDDTTVLVIKLRQRSVVNMIVGPPQNKEDDNHVLRLFFAKGGLHIVSGGSTARAVSKFLNSPITMMEETQTEEIPAMGRMEDVDYVTEGVITLKKVLELCEEFEKNPLKLLSFCQKKDAASVLASILIEQATDVNIYFGRAANLAHEGTDIDFQTKLNLIRQLEELLQRMGKYVKISYC
ncbi:MAG: SpoIIE family protein phosphatase [Oscillospiraceae bacterium]|nr:SpoIIE family protein phosphatase [Oscillospiraceae bacterium]